MPYVIIKSGPRDALAKAVLPSGKLLVEINRDTTIEDIKKLVQDETNIDPKKQELSYIEKGRKYVMPVSSPFVYKHIINYEDRERDPDGHYDKNRSSTAFRIDIKFNKLTPTDKEDVLKLHLAAAVNNIKGFKKVVDLVKSKFSPSQGKKFDIILAAQYVANFVIDGSATPPQCYTSEFKPYNGTPPSLNREKIDILVNISELSSIILDDNPEVLSGSTGALKKSKKSNKRKGKKSKSSKKSKKSKSSKKSKRKSKKKTRRRTRCRR